MSVNCAFIRYKSYMHHAFLPSHPPQIMIHLSLEQLSQEIEAEMARTQKNKATNYHLGTLKAKLAKLRNELLIEQGGGGGGGGRK